MVKPIRHQPDLPAAERPRSRKLRFNKPATLFTVTIAAALAVAGYAQPARPPILEYIKQTWAVLPRSNRTLAQAAADPKFQPEANGRWPVYLPRSESVEAILRQLRRDMTDADLRKIELRLLPEDLSGLRDQGLLYLPRPYVVPGGRFNEMYGWDSYFIQLGL